MKRHLISLTWGLLPAVFLLSAAVGAQQRVFPHDKHSFAECSTCHGGVTAGVWAQSYPTVANCQACHDGSTAPRVAWKPPAKPRVSSLKFSHTSHPLECSTCHSGQAASRGASMGYPAPETCLGCHAPKSRHEEVRDCSLCHAPVVDFRLTQNGKLPPFHGEAFKTNHAAAAAARQPDCTSCHAENTCNQCHRSQKEPAFHPLNFLASHKSEAFGRVSDCASCHSTEAFCRECHLAVGLKGGKDQAAPFHSSQPLWILGHAQAARQDLESCASCHRQSDCLRCHSASVGMRVNPHGTRLPSSSLADRNRSMCKICHTGGSDGGDL